MLPTQQHTTLSIRDKCVRIETLFPSKQNACLTIGITLLSSFFSRTVLRYAVRATPLYSTLISMSHTYTLPLLHTHTHTLPLHTPNTLRLHPHTHVQHTHTRMERTDPWDVWGWGVIWPPAILSIKPYI